MNYIVNPMWFYLISIFDSIDTLALFACILILIIWLFSPLCLSYLDELDIHIEKIIKPLFKKSVILFVASLIIAIIAPSREDMEKMLIASYTTEDNISAATNYGKDLVDYIFDKVNSTNKEEEKK